MVKLFQSKCGVDHGAMVCNSVGSNQSSILLLLSSPQPCADGPSGSTEDEDIQTLLSHLITSRQGLFCVKMVANGIISLTARILLEGDRPAFELLCNSCSSAAVTDVRHMSA
ncbi:hypothetical protein AFUB_077100 [Aspergillus fumigatus A1163]|uniref:Uncharacterized protein n=1 Tax=Aspergillus fumigatus (strain CBS 144.89 / FGSC A1163 / CEA10) TaxID=451804 RepID=B0Y8E9_ASPFC|nr:hypothetical protein AFUB_077100 [Aspergillus fumigatus A1163]